MVSIQILGASRANMPASQRMRHRSARNRFAQQVCHSGRRISASLLFLTLLPLPNPSAIPPSPSNAHVQSLCACEITHTRLYTCPRSCAISIHGTTTLISSKSIEPRLRSWCTICCTQVVPHLGLVAINTSPGRGLKPRPASLPFSGARQPLG